MQDILTLINHHEMLSFALCIVLTLLILIEFLKQKSAATKISPAQATHLINHENAVVIDIRNTDAFNSGHISGSISLPFSTLKENPQKIEKYQTQPIILVCAQGIESQQAASRLKANNAKIYILNGGLRTWKAEQLPLVKN